MTSADWLEIPGMQERTDHFVKAGLEVGIPNEVDDGAVWGAAHTVVGIPRNEASRP